MKRKYCYVIANKETAEILKQYPRLPFFLEKSEAKYYHRIMDLESYKKHQVQKITLSDLEDLILKSKKA